MKKIQIIVFALLLSNVSFSQKSKGGIGGFNFKTLKPISDSTKKLYKNGWGLEGMIGAEVQKGISLTLNVGFNTLNPNVPANVTKDGTFYSTIGARKDFKLNLIKNRELTTFSIFGSANYGLSYSNYNARILNKKSFNSGIYSYGAGIHFAGFELGYYITGQQNKVRGGWFTVNELKFGIVYLSK